jgi:hypothetical protein
LLDGHDRFGGHDRLTAAAPDVAGANNPNDSSNVGYVYLGLM